MEREELTRFLEDQGYRVLQLDYRTRWATLDAIARDGAYLVFVLVRPSFRRPGRREIENIASAAAEYVSSRKLWHLLCRFDVVVRGRDGKLELRKNSLA